MKRNIAYKKLLASPSPSRPKGAPAASCLFPGRFCGLPAAHVTRTPPIKPDQKRFCTEIHFSCNFIQTKKMLDGSAGEPDSPLPHPSSRHNFTLDRRREKPRTGPGYCLRTSRPRGGEAEKRTSPS